MEERKKNQPDVKKFEVRKKNRRRRRIFQVKVKTQTDLLKAQCKQERKEKKKGRHFKNFCTSSFIYSERSLKGSFDTNNAEKDILPISETKKEAGKTREKVWRRLRERESMG